MTGREKLRPSSATRGGGADTGLARSTMERAARSNASSPELLATLTASTRPDDTVRLPGFVRFDAAVYLKTNETWTAQLNVENIFDKGYWASADGNNNISPGQPRTFRVSATARF